MKMTWRIIFLSMKFRREAKNTNLFLLPSRHRRVMEFPSVANILDVDVDFDFFLRCKSRSTRQTKRRQTRRSKITISFPVENSSFFSPLTSSASFLQVSGSTDWLSDWKTTTTKKKNEILQSSTNVVRGKKRQEASFATESLIQLVCTKDAN